MLETLCIRNSAPRYIVSIGKKILLVTHEYNIAKQIEKEIVSRKITDENYNIDIGREE
jgi:hypothetical protein